MAKAIEDLRASRRSPEGEEVGQAAISATAEQPTEPPPPAEPAPAATEDGAGTLESDRVLQAYIDRKNRDKQAQEYRTAKDQLAVIDKLKSGDIDAIAEATSQLGINFDEVIDRYVSGESKPKAEPAPLDPVAQQIAELKQQLEAIQEERAMAQVERELTSAVDAGGDRWALLKRYPGWQDEVVSYIKMEAARGRAVSYESAFDGLQKILKEQVRQHLELARLDPELARDFAPQNPATKPAAKGQPQGGTSSGFADAPMTSGAVVDAALTPEARRELAVRQLKAMRATKDH